MFSDKNFNLIMLSNATIHRLSEAINGKKFCFEIENENRKYILATKSLYDMEEWLYSISTQIKLAKDNKNIAMLNKKITIAEKDIAKFDMQYV